MARKVQRGITIRTEWDDTTKAFVVVLDVNGKQVARLSPLEVIEHANAVEAAAHRASYDAAILGQAIGRGIPSRQASAVVNQMRRDRPPLDPDVTAPLWFEPIVNTRHEPTIKVSLHSAMVARWSVIQADSYARTLLTAQRQADDQTMYRNALMTMQDMGEFRALGEAEALGTFHTF